MLKKLPITAPKTKPLNLIPPYCAINSAINEANICKIIQELKRDRSYDDSILPLYI